jgi:hypothetical protein
MEERRQFIRFPMQLNARCLEKSSNAWHDFSTINISRGGIGIKISSKESFNLDSSFQSEVILPSRKEPIEITGGVAWMKDIRVNAGFNIIAGIKFIRIGSSCKYDLLDSAYNSWHKRGSKMNFWDSSLDLKETDTLKRAKTEIDQLTKNIKDASPLADDVLKVRDEIVITVNGTKWNQLAKEEQCSLANKFYKVMCCEEWYRPVSLIDEEGKKVARSLKGIETGYMVVLK